MKLLRIYLLLGIFTFANCFNVLGAAPDSGSILSEQRQRDRKYIPNAFQDVEVDIAPELAAESDITVNVKAFKFSGYESLVSLEELNKLSAAYIGKKISFAGLQRLTQIITSYLREKKGYLLSRAYLPQQDITEGNIAIAIIAGRLDGNVELSIEGDHRINKTFLEQVANRAVSEGGTVFLSDVERAVLLINDLPGVSTRAYLDKGMVPGTSRLSLLTREEKWVNATLSGDNFGNRYTGRFRRMGQVAFLDSFGRGDLLQLTYINADDLNQGLVGFSIPVGNKGTLVDFSYNGLTYQLGGKLKDLEAKGTAHTMSGGIRYPFKRTRNASIWLGSGYEYYLLEDKSLGAVTSDRNVAVGNFNLIGNFYDEFFGGGLTTFSTFLYVGDTNISDGKSSDDSGARTDGDFCRATYTMARLQRMTAHTALFVSARGQIADGNLDSSQKIILGGPTGVRAYPIGEGSGDSGHIFTVENRVDLPFSKKFRTQLVGFIDAGQVGLHEDTWNNSVTNISGRNHYWLSGAGVGINIEKPQSYRVQFSYAHTLGKNPGRDTSDNNADNQDESGRFWAQATIWF